MKQTNMKKLARKIAFNKQRLEIIKAKKIRNIKVGIAVALFILLTGLFINLINKTVEFFRINTIVKYQIIKIELHKPFEIISLAELKRRELQNEMIEDITSKAIEEYLKPKTGIEDSKNGCQITSQINPKTFFDIIAIKESGNNTNDNPRALHNVCKAKGMYNAIGYSPQTKFCFKDEQEARLYVAYYIKKNCDGKSLDSCLCYWNTGTWVNNCAYSEGNLSLAN